MTCLSEEKYSMGSETTMVVCCLDHTPMLWMEHWGPEAKIDFVTSCPSLIVHTLNKHLLGGYFRKLFSGISQFMGKKA